MRKQIERNCFKGKHKTNLGDLFILTIRTINEILPSSKQLTLEYH